MKTITKMVKYYGKVNVCGKQISAVRILQDLYNEEYRKLYYKWDSGKFKPKSKYIPYNFQVFYYNQNETFLKNGEEREDLCLYGAYTTSSEADIEAKEAQSAGLEGVQIVDVKTGKAYYY